MEQQEEGGDAVRRHSLQKITGKGETFILKCAHVPAFPFIQIERCISFNPGYRIEESYIFFPTFYSSIVFLTIVK